MCIRDRTPGIRSLQVHYQPETLSLQTLLDIVAGEWDAVCAAKDLKVPSRIVHLPLSWDDPACALAIDKYMTTVRKDAPWCPSNLEFIRRINDLPNLDEVYRLSLIHICTSIHCPSPLSTCKPSAVGRRMVKHS